MGARRVAAGSAGGSAASTAGPQPQPARSAISARARVSILSSACNSRSSARAASISATQASAIVRGGAQPERGGDPARRRDAEPRRPDKGEKLQYVERREAGEVEPSRDGPRMADDRDSAAAQGVEPGIEPGARLFRRQRLDLARRRTAI